MCELRCAFPVTDSRIASGGTQIGLGKLGGSLSNNSDIRSLLSEPVIAVVEQLLGPMEYLRALGAPVAQIAAQIALRFPELVPDCAPGKDAPALDESGATHLLCYFRMRHLRLVLSFYCVLGWHTDGFRRGKTHEFRFSSCSILL